MTNKTWLNKMETAEYIGITTRTIDRWRKEPQTYYHFPGSALCRRPPPLEH